MNKILIALSVVVVAVVGYYAVGMRASAPSSTEKTMGADVLPGSATTGNSSASETINPNPPAQTVTPASTDPANTVTLTVEGGNFTFTPNALTVKKGQTVKLTFNNLDGFHDWKIDEFNAHTSQIKGGNSETITFVADKAGSFEYYCSVGKHRAMGMKGTLTVTE